jgi:hypothetical protein
MAMGVMGIGEMPVAMAQGLVPMGMAVRLSRRVLRRVVVAVVDVMAVAVSVGERRMQMLMGMALAQM